MAKMTIELCPETGICSLIRPDGSKADLLPDEVDALRGAGADAKKLREVVAGSDAAFAASLSEAELKQIASEVK
jgi:hypothetical protein